MADRETNAATPPGYVLVPVEMTEAMIGAFSTSWRRASVDKAKARYARLLAAAPVPAAQAATAEPVAWILKRSDNGIEQLTRDKNWADFSRRVGHSVTPLYAAPVAGQAEDAARLTDEQIEKIAHRRAMRHIPSKDPILRKYVFSLPLLIGFVRAVQQAGQAETGRASSPEP